MASEMTAGDAGAVAWRIFGSGESPETGMSSYELIDGVIQKHVVSDKQPFVAATVRGWFAESGGYRWLRDEAKPEIARKILEGIEVPFTPRAVWAVAAIDADVMQRAMETCWTNSETVPFVDALYEALADVSRRDHVMNPSRIGGLAQEEVGSARVPRDAIEKESQLWTFRSLGTAPSGAGGVWPSSGGRSLRWTWPWHWTVTTHGGRLRVWNTPPCRHAPCFRCRRVVHRMKMGDVWDWIGRDAGDAVIAAAIFHVLRAATSVRMDRSRDEYRTGVANDPALRQANVDGQRDCDGKSLIEALVGRLAALERVACARWIGEILTIFVARSRRRQ